MTKAMKKIQTRIYRFSIKGDLQNEKRRSCKEEYLVGL